MPTAVAVGVGQFVFLFRYLILHWLYYAFGLSQPAAASLMEFYHHSSCDRRSAYRLAKLLELLWLMTRAQAHPIQRQLPDYSLYRQLSTMPHFSVYYVNNYISNLRFVHFLVAISTEQCLHLIVVDPIKPVGE